MRIFNTIQFPIPRRRRPGPVDAEPSQVSPIGPEPSCQNCAHFQNDPAFIEKAYPGLTTMSSGFASVRDRDGICDHNQLYLSARDTCPHFTPQTVETFSP